MGDLTQPAPHRPNWVIWPMHPTPSFPTLEDTIKRWGNGQPEGSLEMDKIIRRVTAGIVAVTVALGLALGAVAFTPESTDARPRDGFGHDGANCLYAGAEYSHGAVIKQGDGNLYKCDHGEWDYYDRG